MTKIQHFNAINIKTPLEAIYKRLGWRDHATRISSRENEKFNQYIDEALSYIKLKGAAARIPIKEKRKSETILISGDVFESKLLASLVKKSSELLLLGATAGKNIIKTIQEFEKENLTKSVVFDAVASEMTDAALIWIFNYYKQGLCRENKQLTSKRISCGYGDFLLDYQLNMFNILRLDRLNIKITDTFMLIPEKSVTALAGIIER